MFKKVLSLSIIVLMLFSFVAGVSAQNNCISIYSKTQDNDGDGYFIFYNENKQLIRSIEIKPGERKTYSLENVDTVIFHSKGRHSEYDAYIKDLTNYRNDRNMDNININVDVNFYKKNQYYNKFWIDKDVYYRECTQEFWYLIPRSDGVTSIYYGSVHIGNANNPFREIYVSGFID